MGPTGETLERGELRLLDHLAAFERLSSGRTRSAGARLAGELGADLAELLLRELAPPRPPGDRTAPAPPR